MSDFDLVSVDDPNPWDQQPREPSDAFHAFTVYRNLGPKRTYSAVSKQLGVSSATTSLWATDYSWRDRTTAWDFYQDRIFQAEIAEYTRQMAKRHMESANDALIALQAPVRALLDKFTADPEALIEEFGTKDLMKLMRLAQDSIKIMPALMNAERLASGQPTQISEHTETQNINYNDSQRIGEVLDVLRDAGVLAAFTSEGSAGEIIDAETIEVDDGGSELETDGLSPGAA